MILTDLKLNETAEIISLIIEDKKFNVRLQELGLYVGSKVKLLNFSPLKQTILLQIFNSVFAIKQEIAQLIEVKLL